MAVQHNLANYPKEFITCVVTKGKICLQFGSVDVKLRFKEGGEYIKLPSTVKALPISVQGTKIDTTSVGCPIPVIFSMLEDVIGALGEQFSLYTPLKEKKKFIEDTESLADYLAHLVVCMKKEVAWKKRKKASNQLS